MTEAEARARIETLRRDITKHNRRYYEEAAPTITDREYDQLYRELDRRGMKTFRPVCYLTDEWGCPDQQPVLGIPFYLADPKLRTIEKAADALESERQIMMYMRHEAGHVFNYAYRLYTTPEWRELFGPFFRSFRDAYRPKPFSRDFVTHIEGWYA